MNDKKALRGTFLADVHCDSCGHAASAVTLSVLRHSVDFGDRRVIPANGPTKCGGCAGGGTYHLPEPAA